ncbi:(2Fe-2S)-binding protein [Phreatobacter aquaticus]|uniref:(2Fe-2S)-binding protein n=1 Tax=Phreatobacter aquaticus TaxID=2570229 RepID=A0A4D7QUQ5_9HYPH|nr:(2Fe-2S)-binding protein [Phreatobacter aquaticus]QCK88767.1 (2Fe-2S)-binding protein [Phreatobacter aquaticus]
MTVINVNGQSRESKADPSTPLLWVLREEFGLTGTKYGCGVAACGACTIHIDGVAARACATPLSGAVGAKIVTIEGLPGGADHPVIKAWITEQAPQCGYCQSGQVMSAAALLAQTPKPTRQQIVDAMDGNLCRCGSYNQIIAAVERASQGA